MGATDGSRDSRLTKILMALMGVFLALVVYAGGLAAVASGTAYDASRKADKVASDLSVHAARQNGSLESIAASLAQLRTDQLDQRKVVDELLRRSYSDHPTSPP